MIQPNSAREDVGIKGSFRIKGLAQMSKGDEIRFDIAQILKCFEYSAV